ncbi:MAG: hypothetical protein IJY71_08105, partial [Clostridia bacterium]|nr:hypothetical protein [Clostridia bacterium]
MRQPVSFCDKEGAKRDIFVEEQQTKNRPGEKVGFVFEKVQEFRNLLWSKHLRAYLPSRSDAH